MTIMRVFVTAVALAASAASLPIGEHHESSEGKVDRVIRFCDFASADNRWEFGNAYRTWLPQEWLPHEK